MRTLGFFACALAATVFGAPTARADLPLVMVANSCAAQDAAMTSFVCERSTPTDLAGLPHTVRRLELKAPVVADLRPLASKPTLQALVVPPEVVSSMPPLPSVSTLGIVCTASTSQSSVPLDTLKNLSGLRQLEITGCTSKTAKLEDLAGTNLVHVDLRGLGGGNLQGLERVPGLQSLWAAGSSIVLPKANANLRSLMITSSSVLDTNKLRDATALENVWIDAPLTNLAPLGGLPIKSLTVGSDTDLGPVLAMRSLETLNVKKARVPATPLDLRVLAWHPTLKTVGGEGQRARWEGVKGNILGFQWETTLAK